MRKTIAMSLVVASSVLTAQAFAQIAVVSNDHKVTQDNGVTSNLPQPQPDTATILDLGSTPVRVVGTINGVPGSVVGPPLSVVVTPDASMALVASSSKIDPKDPTKTVNDDRVTVLDLKDRKVIGTLHTADGAAGMSITRDGKRVYVANRLAGSVSILAVDGKDVRLVTTLALAPPASLLSHIALSADGTTAIATRNGDAKVEILKLSGDSISIVGTVDVAPRPYAAAIHPGGKLAVVSSLGDPNGNGILTLIDLTVPSGKVVATADVGHESLEGMMLSPDGKWIAGVTHGGSTRPRNAPQYRPNGTVVLYRLDGTRLTKVSEAPIGVWSQGAAFSTDGRTLLVENMIQKNVMVFRNDNGKLTDTGQKIDVVGGAAAIRTSNSL